MNWDTYEPLSTDNVIHFEDQMDIIQGDMFGGQPDDPEDNDDYLITHIAEDIFAFNYNTSQFEHLSENVVRDWMDNDRVFRPILSSHSFTVEDEDGSPVGIRAVGVASQTEQLVKEYGPNVFGFTIGLVFEEGLPATEIQEPYSNDVHVTHPSFDCFIDKALTELPEAIAEKTGIGSDFAQELVRGILGTLEQNARTRLSIDTDPILIDEDRDEFHVSEPEDNERSFVFSEDEDENQIVEFHGMN